MEFILKDKRFVITDAQLSATILDPYWVRKYHPKGNASLFWCLDVYAEGELDDELCEIRASVEEMRFPIRRWTDLVEQTIEWSGPYDEHSGIPNGTFYLYSHERIKRARLRFTERDGNQFRFEWEGVCDVLFNEEYGHDVPFSSSGWGKFSGVTVFGSASDTNESLRLRLVENLDPHDFIQQAQLFSGHRYDSGVKMCRAVFTPLVMQSD